MRAYRSFVATLTSLALAASPYDPQYSGPRAALNDVSIDQALRVCAQAAEARPVRPRYQYLYGWVLWNAQRHEEAAQQFAAARSAGNAWGALALGGLSERGSGVAQSYEVAANLYREAASAG